VCTRLEIIELSRTIAVFDAIRHRSCSTASPSLRWRLCLDNNVLMGTLLRYHLGAAGGGIFKYLHPPLLR